MLYVIFFILGASLGSFSLLFADRLMQGRGPFGRSQCNHCKTLLRAADMIPVLSFLFLAGVCRHCKNHIDRWHFFVEVLLGLLFVGAVFFVPQIGPSDVFIRLFLLSSLLVLFVFDTRYGVLPDLITLPTLLFVVGYQWIGGVDIINMFGGVVIGAGFFALQWIVSRGKWVGAGDIRLGALMGAVLGVYGVLIALGVAYICGAVISLILLGGKVIRRGTRIPFAWFLIPSLVIVWYFGNDILGLLM